MKDLIIPRTKFAEPETNSPKANNSKCVTDNRKISDVGRINLRSRLKLFKWVLSCSRLTFASVRRKVIRRVGVWWRSAKKVTLSPPLDFARLWSIIPAIIHYAGFATPHTLVVLQLERARRLVMLSSGLQWLSDSVNSNWSINLPFLTAS